MGMASEDLLATLQILPGFFSNCLFLALYDSVVLVKRAVSRLSCSRSAGSGEWRRMLTSAGLRAIWKGFLLDAYKQVSMDVVLPGPWSCLPLTVIIIIITSHITACFIIISTAVIILSHTCYSTFTILIRHLNHIGRLFCPSI